MSERRRLHLGGYVEEDGPGIRVGSSSDSAGEYIGMREKVELYEWLGEHLYGDEDNETVVSYDSDEPVTELPDDERSCVCGNDGCTDPVGFDGEIRSNDDDDGPVQTMADVERRLQALERQ